ncbi:MAG: DUF3482 domain-containing protein [Gammaproteobacteria bacterium]|nr:MAG: DUF3482 domain-containing protein [Gammaproteobacteria bacterium]
MIPTFAVVGHPNKGKSSIVATLAEDDRLAIGPTPGTTRKAMPHTFSIDGQPQYVLIDTPGFQRAAAVLEWLEARATTASARPALVAEFLDAHEGDSRFHDECELLRPILDGAGILYVVDGSKPYGAEYELEMQILQWTGRPRMALINLIGDEDHQAEWRQALDQYFSLVRVFDAVGADFDTRVGLLEVFGELDPDWRQPLDRAVRALVEERAARRRRSAAEIARQLIDCAGMSEEARLAPGETVDARREALTDGLKKKLRRREARCREAVQGIYRHQSLTRDEPGQELIDTDLFTDSGWRLFGLSRERLALSGALTGALAGGGIDALLGGASLALGAGIGAVIGGAGAWFGGGELAKVKVLGESLGGQVVQVGPVKAPNFPWVLLGRAWLHHQLVAERNHAHRAVISLAVQAEENLMDALPDALSKELGRAFPRLRSRGDNPEFVTALTEQIDQVLSQSLTEPEPDV